jgi:hypothetical protein
LVTGFGLTHRDAPQYGCCGVVVDVRPRVQETAVPVVRVLAHAGIGHENQVREALAQRAQGALDRPFRVMAPTTDRVLRLRDPEEEDGSKARRHRLLHAVRGDIHGPAEHSRHGRHLFAHATALRHEDRKDEVVYGQT